MSDLPTAALGDHATPGVRSHAFGASSPALAVAVGVVVISALLTPVVLRHDVVLVPSLVLLGLILAWGWPGMLGTAAPRGSAATLAAGVAVIGVSVSGWGNLSGLRWLAVGGAVAVLFVFLHQLLRRDGRPRLAESASGNLLAVAVLLSGACVAESVRLGVAGSVLVALAAGSVAAVVELAGRWRAARVWVGPVAVLLGAVTGLGLAEVPAVRVDSLTAAVVGALAAAVAGALRTVLSSLPTIGQARPRLVSAAASVLILGVVPLLVAWVAGSIALL